MKILKHLSQNLHLKKTNPVLKDPNVMDDVKELQKKFVIVTIDKASNNFAFICKKIYVDRLLTEVKNNSNTYVNVTEDKIDIILINHFATNLD